MNPTTLLLCAVFLSAPAAVHAGSPLSLHRSSSGGWELQRDGQPFFLRGAGGQRHLDTLVKCGGNAIRTWGIESLAEKTDGKPLVERARELNLVICAGIWVGHERHGFDYGDRAQVKDQREKIRAAVARWKDEPSIGLWGLGNEMEGPAQDGSDPRIWKELEELAKIVKREDPTRPVMTVIAGFGRDKVLGVKNHCPSIDILGVNAYAPASAAGKAVRDAGWKKAFVLSEFGPVGHWEVGQTSWGAPIEPSSRQKAAKYYATHELVVEESLGSCIGTFAFLWGQKQERTSTWYGMFLKSGEKLPPVDAMARAWTGKWPDNRCPRVEKFSSTVSRGTIAPGEAVEVTLEARDPNDDPVTYEWTIAAESTDLKQGGDAETAPPEHRIPVKELGDGKWRFHAPDKPGAYRMFLVVRDGRGAASAENFPFLVR